MRANYCIEKDAGNARVARAPSPPAFDFDFAIDLELASTRDLLTSKKPAHGRVPRPVVTGWFHIWPFACRPRRNYPVMTSCSDPEDSLAVSLSYWHGFGSALCTSWFVVIVDDQFRRTIRNVIASGAKAGPPRSIRRRLYGLQLQDYANTRTRPARDPADWGDPTQHNSSTNGGPAEKGLIEAADDDQTNSSVFPRRPDVTRPFRDTSATNSNWRDVPSPGPKSAGTCFCSPPPWQPAVPSGLTGLPAPDHSTPLRSELPGGQTTITSGRSI
jgi:hypothetical protein